MRAGLKAEACLQYVPPKPAPEPIKNALSGSSGSKKTTTTTTTEIEVLNPKGVAAASASSQPAAAEDESTELPELTPSLEGFSKLPLYAYEQSWEYIKQHRDVVVPGASDALLVAAFTAQGEGKSKYAKQCVHQSLLLQYGDKLGKDGLKLFFQRYVI